MENRLADAIKEFKQTHPGYPRDTYDYLLRLGLQACVAGGVQAQPHRYSGPDRVNTYIEAHATMAKYFNGFTGLYMRALGEICGEKLRYWHWGQWRAAGQVPSQYVAKVRELTALLNFLDGLRMLTNPPGIRK